LFNKAREYEKLKDNKANLQRQTSAAERTAQVSDIQSSLFVLLPTFIRNAKIEFKNAEPKLLRRDKR